jgi:hypothetical protein
MIASGICPVRQMISAHFTYTLHAVRDQSSEATRSLSTPAEFRECNPNDCPNKHSGTFDIR